MRKRTNSLKRDRTGFEWAILGLSIAAIVAIVAGLIVSSLSYESGPADLRVVLRPDAGHSSRFFLTVINRGGVTAEEVRIDVSRGSQVVEVEFHAVPKGDKEEAIVEIAGSAQPTARVHSYQEP